MNFHENMDIPSQFAQQRTRWQLLICQNFDWVKKPCQLKKRTFMWFEQSFRSQQISIKQVTSKLRKNPLNQNKFFLYKKDNSDFSVYTMKLQFLHEILECSP